MLPLNGSLTENIFSIFDTADYTIVKPTFKSKEEYCGGTSNQTGGLILPELQADKFLFLKPQDSIVSVINLYKYYNFSDAKLKGKKYFELTPSITFPLVDKSMRHLTDWDTVYYKYEPVYFDIRLSAKHFSVDSERIRFGIP